MISSRLDDPLYCPIMPQVFHVLRCYSCATFQVHQVKKSTRWSCKICGDKQSIKKIYGEGTGADCRHHVQKLNMLRATEDELTLPVAHETSCCHRGLTLLTQAIPRNHFGPGQSSEMTVSKWKHYLTQVEDTEETNDGASDDMKFTLDRRTFDQSKKERKRDRSVVRGQKRKCETAAVHHGDDDDDLDTLIADWPAP
ncbi:MRN complex-interacting protein [Lamellibrachia satsuma]|nr:MRN complex-interacting protein [Lamellibrachia satsuma]